MDHVKDLFAKIGWNRGNQKEFIGSNRTAKPYYLKKLSFSRRYPRVFVFGGGIASFLVFFSAPIYHFFFTTPADVTPEQMMWKEERMRGKTHVQVMREEKERRIKQNEEKLAAKKLLSEQKLA